VLRDAGFRQPPVDIARVLQTRRLDSSFYDLKEPNLLRRFQHRVKIGAHKLTELVERVQLKALLLFDERQVLIDSTLPDVRIVRPSVCSRKTAMPACPEVPTPLVTARRPFPHPPETRGAH
jgi:hypothetical protein